MTPTESTDLQSARNSVIRCSAWLAGQPLTLLTGDCRTVLKSMPDESVNCCVTSPPYWGLRNYGHPDQIGQESTPEEYVESLRGVFVEVRRVLRKDGTCWLNLGDSYCSTAPGTMGDIMGNLGLGDPAAGARQNCRPNTPQGLKPKDLCMIPARVALALQADGWYLRSDIIWQKKNCMPESVTDRPTRSHEYLFLLSKSERYHYDHEAIKEPCIYDLEKRIGQPNFDNQGGGEKDSGDGNRSHRKVLVNLKKREDKQRGHSRRHDGFNDRWDKMEREDQCTGMRNKRDVWTVAPANYPDAHFATYPPDLIKPCILAGCPAGGLVLDPFGGSGTTGMVAIELGRKAILIELNAEYAKLCAQRCAITPGFPLAC